MKKDLFILGSPRSGKTTLANQIGLRFNFNVISGDALVDTFEQIFPEMKMWGHKNEKNIVPFFFQYMKNIKHHGPNRNLVIEGTDIWPKTANAMLDKEKYRMVVIARPNLEPESFVVEIRKFEKPNDWTTKHDDADLLKQAEWFIKQAKQMRDEAIELGIHFMDTTGNRDAVLNDFMDNLDNFLS